MKKLYSLLTAFLISYSLSATVHTVAVQNFQFNPSTNFSVDLGDTINFQWSSGTHTTTSTTIPAGATSWNAPMTSANQTFQYVPSVEGTYNFFCSIHPSMTGSFTVVNTSSIKSLVVEDGLFITPVDNGSAVKVGFNLTRNANVKISLLDLTGKVAKVLVNNSQMIGKYSEIYTTDDLQKGIYIVEMLAGSERYTKRIILQ